MTKKIYILLILMLGVTLPSGATYACGSKANKSCCKEENVESHSAEKSETNACCSKDNEETDDCDGCGGRCGDPSCHCPVLQLSLIVPFFQELEIKNNDYSFKEHNLSYIETYLSSGFYYIWTPPNIR